MVVTIVFSLFLRILGSSICFLLLVLYILMPVYLGRMKGRVLFPDKAEEEHGNEDEADESQMGRCGKFTDRREKNSNRRNNEGGSLAMLEPMKRMTTRQKASCCPTRQRIETISVLVKQTQSTQPTPQHSVLADSTSNDSNMCKQQSKTKGSEKKRCCRWRQTTRETTKSRCGPSNKEAAEKIDVEQEKEDVLTSLENIHFRFRPSKKSPQCKTVSVLENRAPFINLESNHDRSSSRKEAEKASRTSTQQAQVFNGLTGFVDAPLQTLQCARKPGSCPSRLSKSTKEEQSVSTLIAATAKKAETALPKVSTLVVSTRGKNSGLKDGGSLRETLSDSTQTDILSNLEHRISSNTMWKTSNKQSTISSKVKNSALRAKPDQAERHLGQKTKVMNTKSKTLKSFKSFKTDHSDLHQALTEDAVSIPYDPKKTHVSVLSCNAKKYAWLPQSKKLSHKPGESVCVANQQESNKVPVSVQLSQGELEQQCDFRKAGESKYGRTNCPRGQKGKTDPASIEMLPQVSTTRSKDIAENQSHRTNEKVLESETIKTTCSHNENLTKSGRDSCEQSNIGRAALINIGSHAELDYGNENDETTINSAECQQFNTFTASFSATGSCTKRQEQKIDNASNKRATDWTQDDCNKTLSDEGHCFDEDTATVQAVVAKLEFVFSNNEEQVEEAQELRSPKKDTKVTTNDIRATHKGNQVQKISRNISSSDADGIKVRRTHRQRSKPLRFDEEFLNNDEKPHVLGTKTKFPRKNESTTLGRRIMRSLSCTPTNPVILEGDGSGDDEDASSDRKDSKYIVFNGIFKETGDVNTVKENTRVRSMGLEAEISGRDDKKCKNKGQKDDQTMDASTLSGARNAGPFVTKYRLCEEIEHARLKTMTVPYSISEGINSTNIPSCDFKLDDFSPIAMTSDKSNHAQMSPEEGEIRSAKTPKTQQMDDNLSKTTELSGSFETEHTHLARNIAYEQVEVAVGNDALMREGRAPEFRPTYDSEIFADQWFTAANRKKESRKRKRKRFKRPCYDQLEVPSRNSYMRILMNLPPLFEQVMEEKRLTRKIPKKKRKSYDSANEGPTRFAAKKAVNKIEKSKRIQTDSDEEQTIAAKDCHVQPMADPGKTCSDLHCDEWTGEEVSALRTAYHQTDALSRTFWNDIASLVEGKTAACCQAKWFSLAKTPPREVNQRKREDLKIKISAQNNLPYIDDDDDLFNSTPLRETDAEYKCEGVNGAVQCSNFRCCSIETGSPIKYDKTSRKMSPQEDDEDLKITDFRSKPGYKTYMRDFKKKLRESKLQKRKIVKSKKSSTMVYEQFGDGEVAMKGNLSPGGTLMVKNLYEEEEEDEIFFASDSEGEDENDQNGFDEA